MAASLFSADDYRDALLKLLPTGRAWSKDPGSTLFAVMSGLAPSLARLDARAQSLLVDAFPTTTLELLPEWESSLGLPDPCEGADQVLEQRRSQVVSRLTSAGGQSKPYFLGVLARLGYVDATITEFAPFRADVSSADQPMADEVWAFAWQVNLPELRVFYFQADISAADEPLLTIANDVAICVLNALKPAHTILFFTNEAGAQLDFSNPDNSGFLPAL